MAALGQIAADSEISIENNSMSTAEGTNNDLLSLVKATPSGLDLHQAAVETKRKRREWEIIHSFNSPQTVQPIQLEGFLLKRRKGPIIKGWHKVSKLI